MLHKTALLFLVALYTKEVVFCSSDILGLGTDISNISNLPDDSVKYVSMYEPDWSTDSISAIEPNVSINSDSPEYIVNMPSPDFSLSSIETVGSIHDLLDDLDFIISSDDDEPGHLRISSPGPNDAYDDYSSLGFSFENDNSIMAKIDERNVYDFVEIPLDFMDDIPKPQVSDSDLSAIEMNSSDLYYLSGSDLDDLDLENSRSMSEERNKMHERHGRLLNRFY